MDENRTQSNDRDFFENDKESDIYNGFHIPEETPNNVEESSSIQGDKPLTKQQKYMLGGILFVGIGILVLSFLQMKNLLKIPWPKLFANEEKNPYYVEQYQKEKEAKAQKQKDTDGDGLNDYDELNVYFTSPYLDDSDSDGDNDKAELSAGTDPNCPKGQECFRVGQNSSNSSKNVSDLINGSGSNLIPTPTTIYQPTAAELREILKQSGQFTIEQINSYTDEQLLDIYNQLVNQSQGETLSLDSNTMNFFNKTPAQLRETLKLYGFDDATLNSISDEELMTLYQRALQEVTKSQNQ